METYLTQHQAGNYWMVIIYAKHNNNNISVIIRY